MSQVEYRDIGTNTGSEEELFAWMSIQPDGESGLFAMGSVPLVVNTKAMAEKLRPIVAEALTHAPGFKAKLIRYRAESVLETL